MNVVLKPFVFSGDTGLRLTYGFYRTYEKSSIPTEDFWWAYNHWYDADYDTRPTTNGLPTPFITTPWSPPWKYHENHGIKAVIKPFPHENKLKIMIVCHLGARLVSDSGGGVWRQNLFRLKLRKMVHKRCHNNLFLGFLGLGVITLCLRRQINICDFVMVHKRRQINLFLGFAKIYCFHGSKIKGW